VVATSNPPETVLSKLPHERGLSILSTFAFSVSEGPKRKIEARYIGSLVIRRSGLVERIDHIDFLELWGGTFWRKLFSAINSGTRRISVHLSPQPQIGLSAIRQFVLEYLPEDRNRPEPYLESVQPLEVLVRRVQEAKSVSDIFDLIGVPAPENTLDVLCCKG
jgi:hypothetical protein